MAAQIYLNVGMHKTGSTYIQSKVFPTISAVRYLGPGRVEDAEAFSVVEDLAYANPAFFDPERERDRFQAALGEETDRPVLVSSEELFGEVTSNFHNNPFIARNLKNMFPDARVIVVVRRQNDWIESNYKQVIKGGFTLCFEPFVGWNGSAFESGRHLPGSRLRINVKELDWLRYVRNYAELFGKQNLLVLPFEQLMENPDAFVAAITDFMGVERIRIDARARVNRGYSGLGLAVARVLNRIFDDQYHEPKLLKQTPFHRYFMERREASPFFGFMTRVTGMLTVARFVQHIVDPLSPGPARLLDERMTAALMEMHADHNRMLAEEFCPDLSRFGYF